MNIKEGPKEAHKSHRLCESSLGQVEVSGGASFAQ